MTDPQATAQPTKTYKDGLREAAEIARAKHAEHEARVASAPKANMFDLGAEWAARYIAEAIEAKAREKP